MNHEAKVQKMIDDLTYSVDSQLNKIIKEMKGQKIKDAKLVLKSNQFDLNPTKRNLVDTLEEKLTSAINEQVLLFESDTFESISADHLLIRKVYNRKEVPHEK